MEQKMKKMSSIYIVPRWDGGIIEENLRRKENLVISCHNRGHRVTMHNFNDIRQGSLKGSMKAISYDLFLFA
jgi:hypothetical protein